MTTKRSILPVILAVSILLFSALSNPRFTEATQARIDAPNSTWEYINISPGGPAPVSACLSEKALGDDVLAMSFKMPQVRWTGHDFLPVTAEYQVYKWSSTENRWLPYGSPIQYNSSSNLSNISFSFAYGLLGEKGLQTGSHLLAVEEGYYNARLALSIPPQETTYHWVPFSGGNAVNPYYCYVPPAQALSSDENLYSPSNNTASSKSPQGPLYNVRLPYIVNTWEDTSEITPIPQPTATHTVSPLPTPSLPPTTEGIGDPGFESGPQGAWQQYSENGYEIVHTGNDIFWPRSGNWMAWLGGLNNEVSSITQTITVPSTHPFLSAYTMVTSEEDYCYYDLVSVYINDSIVDNNGICKETGIDSWQRGYIDLRNFAGQTVTLSIRMENDESLLSSVFLDDFAFVSGIETTSPTATPPPPTPTAAPLPSILNPDFELGDNGDWETYSELGYDTIFTNSGAHSGDWLAWLGGADNEIGYIQQTMQVPLDQPILTYWGYISSNETVCGVDYVTILVNSNPIFGYDLCTENNNTRWGQAWVNLRAYRGTAATVQIRVTTNESLLSSLYVDDFAFASTAPNMLDGGNMSPAGMEGQHNGNGRPTDLPGGKGSNQKER
jgi:hypothetical protein